MKLIFAGTPEFAAVPLRALIKQHEICGVFTQPDRRSGRGKKLNPPIVKEVALNAGIPVFQPESLKDQADIIAALAPDVMVVVAYGMLLPQDILAIPRLGCLNIHASLLPRWRGAAPIQRAIEAGDTKSGVSIMQMEVGLDTGPVLQVLETGISDHDTSSSLHDRLAELGAQGILETLARLAEGSQAVPLVQDESQANYAKKIVKSEAQIDWQESAHQIQQRIRAFIPWPICQSAHQDTRLRIWRASAFKQTPTTQAGEIIGVNEHGIEVACGEGILRIETLQRDGSRPLDAAEFCRGYELKAGDCLG